MQVVVKKKVLEQLMKQLAEDRSYRSRNIDQIAGEDRPVMPDAQMATQLSAERVPVEDPDFLPVNTNQLSTAASQIAKEVSPKSVQKFYRGLKKLIQKTSEPKQYKGMSETDLMEILRPIVIREARNPNKPSYLSSGFRDETEDDDTGEKPDTGFRADVPSMTKEPGKKSPGQRKTGEQKKRERIAKKNAVKSTPIVKIAGEKLSSEAIDELESMREKWTMAPSMIAADQIKRRAKIKLPDLTIGDANRILDIFFKTKDKKLPKTLDETGLNFSFQEILTKPDGFDQSIYVQRITITDPQGREEIASGLKNISPIVHTGGPIEIDEVLPDGTERPNIYYLLEGYPFSEQQYMDSLRSSYVEAYNDFQKKLIAQLTKRQEKEQKKLDAAAAKALEKKKPATIQKSLSVGLAKRDAVAMPEEDPEEFKKILSKLQPPVAVSDYEKMTYDEQSEVLSKVAQFLDAQRGPYYDVGEMDYLRDIISDESDYTYAGDEEEIVTTSPVAAGVETLSETFFETAIEPVASYVIETVVENNPDIGKELDYIMDMYGFVNYQDFIGNVENKSIFNGVLTEISKKFLKSDSDAFENVIPDFERLKTASYKKDIEKAKNEEERTQLELANQIYSEFEGRLRLLGVEDVGRLRSIFQYMKSPVAFMKAVDIATRLEAMEGKSETAEAVSNPELLRNLVTNFIKKKVNADPTGFAVAYEKLLTKNGIRGYEGLVKADINDVVSALEEPFSEMIKKQQGARNPGKTPQVDAEVKEAIDNFCTVMGSFFEQMNDAASPAARPILIYLKKFIADLTSAANDPEMDEITPLVLATIDEILNPGKKPKKKK